MKKFIKDAITIVLGLITLFWGMMTRAAMIPDEEYHHCESGKEEWSVYQFVICFAISLLFFVLNVIIQKIGFKKLLSLIFTRRIILSRYLVASMIFATVIL